MAEPKKRGDFLCIELQRERKTHPDTFEEFGVSITRRSNIETGDIFSRDSMLITSPEFREFLASTPRGKRVAESLERGSGGIRIGNIAIKGTREGAYYENFMPFGTPFETIPSMFFGELMRKGIGALIDAQIIKFMKRKYPGLKFAYGLSIAGAGRGGLAKRLLEEPLEQFRDAEQQHRDVKEYLQRKRAEKNLPEIAKRRRAL